MAITATDYKWCASKKNRYRKHVGIYEHLSDETNAKKILTEVLKDKVSLLYLKDGSSWKGIVYEEGRGGYTAFSETDVLLVEGENHWSVLTEEEFRSNYDVAIVK